MNKNLFYILIIVATSFTTPSLVNANFEIGKAMYTKHGFYAEKGRSYTTNYRAGLCIPRGSKVTVIKTSGKYADLLVEHHNIGKVRLKNPIKHSKLGTEMYLNRMLSKTPVNLKNYSKSKRSAIKSCQVVVGMNKDEVIASVGYPPAACNAFN